MDEVASAIDGGGQLECGVSASLNNMVTQILSLLIQDVKNLPKMSTFLAS